MNISNFKQCSNCGACYNICPKNAISVNGDGLFYTPIVDQNLCVDCSLCAGVCPVNQELKGYEPIYACAGWNKKKEIVLKSSSGGVFYGIANRVVSEGGVVFAAVYSNDFKKVEFASSDDMPIEKMLKSKYVESLVGLSFRRIKEALESGRILVLDDKMGSVTLNDAPHICIAFGLQYGDYFEKERIFAVAPGSVYEYDTAFKVWNPVGLG